MLHIQLGRIVYFLCRDKTVFSYWANEITTDILMVLKVFASKRKVHVCPLNSSHDWINGRRTAIKNETVSVANRNGTHQHTQTDDDEDTKTNTPTDDDAISITIQQTALRTLILIKADSFQKLTILSICLLCQSNSDDDCWKYGMRPKLRIYNNVINRMVK